MSIIILPRKLKKQPQGVVRLAHGYKDAMFFSLLRNLSDTDIARGNGFSSITIPSPSIKPWGRTLTFNGLGTYLKTDSGLGVPSSFTITAWVTPAEVGLSYRRICETNYAVGFYLGLNSAGTTYEFITGGSVGTCTGGTVVAGKRDFITATFGNATRKLYINGKLVTTTGSSSGINPSYGYLSLFIGADAGNTNSNPWKGELDTIGVFPRAFSDAEIWELYNNPWLPIASPPRRLQVGESSGESTSYTITPSGGILLDGNGNYLRGKIFLPSGSVSLSGSSIPARGREYNPSGGITFSGTAPIGTASSFLIVPEGGIVLSGAATQSGSHSYQVSPSGGINLTGTAPIASGSINSYTLYPSGGLTASGTALIIKTHIYLPSGSIAFAGGSPMSSNTRVITVTTHKTLTGVGI